MKKAIAILVSALLAAALCWYALAQDRGSGAAGDNAAVSRKKDPGKNPGKKVKMKQGKIRREERNSIFSTPPPGTGYGNLDDSK